MTQRPQTSRTIDRNFYRFRKIDRMFLGMSIFETFELKIAQIRYPSMEDLLEDLVTVIMSVRMETMVWRL